MKIAIASDHAGYELKEKIRTYFKQSKEHEIEDLGPYEYDELDDFPDYAEKMINVMENDEADLGIIMCGTGIGMSIAVNRSKNIRGALLYNEEVAEMAKKHNNANVIIFGGRTMNFEAAINRIEIFLSNEFDVKEKYQRRINKIS
jgi:ribose 5-phosphate isomerase B